MASKKKAIAAPKRTPANRLPDSKLRTLALKNPIRRWRMDHNKQITQIAKHCGVTREAVRMWEYGEKIPRDTHLAKLSALTGFTEGELLGKLEAFKELKRSSGL